MKINKVSIVIENVDEENVSIRLVTDPVPGDDEEIEESPAAIFGSTVWGFVEGLMQDGNGGTLQ